MKKIIHYNCVALLALSVTSCKANETKDPNIIIILADDMGYGDVQAFNSKSVIPTPNLNSLCEEGMVFTDAHTNSAVSTPSRYGLLTGQYTWRTRLKRGVLSGYSDHLIDPSRATIASIVKRKGYNTAVIGKWHLGLDFPWSCGQRPEGADHLLYVAKENEIDYSEPVKNGPNDLGFDYSYIVPGSLDMSPYVFIENGTATAIPDSISPAFNFPSYQREGEISNDFQHKTALDQFTIKAVEYISEQAKSTSPFLLYFSLTAPYKPALPADRFAGKSNCGPYGDMVLQVDWTVGEIINALKENGVEDNTLLIYTSDNGSYMYRIDESEPDNLVEPLVEGFNPSRHKANGEWRGTKADIYEGGHRVPFIVKWPDVVEKGTSSSETLCITDIFATIADVIDIEIGDNEGPDSYSFKDLLSQQEGFVKHPVVHHSVNGSFSLRVGKWKMIFSDGSGGRQKPVGKSFQKPYQLYDMEIDPFETNNLIDSNPAIAKQIEAQLKQIMESSSSKNIVWE